MTIGRPPPHQQPTSRLPPHSRSCPLSPCPGLNPHNNPRRPESLPPQLQLTFAWYPSLVEPPIKILQPKLRSHSQPARPSTRRPQTLTFVRGRRDYSLHLALSTPHAQQVNGRRGFDFYGFSAPRSPLMDTLIATVDDESTIACTSLH
jgi:hypothetical protein